MGNKTSLLFSVTTVNSMSVSANLTVRARGENDTSTGADAYHIHHSLAGELKHVLCLYIYIYNIHT